jgi:hypothetical protein
MEEDLIFSKIPVSIIAFPMDQEFLTAIVLREVTRVSNSPILKVLKKLIDSGYSPIVAEL